MNKKCSNFGLLFVGFSRKHYEPEPLIESFRNNIIIFMHGQAQVSTMILCLKKYVVKNV